MSLYYKDDFVELYHGDCLTEHREWLDADVLCTDPPYGIGWSQPDLPANGIATRGKHGAFAQHNGILNDNDTTFRDRALTKWGIKPAIVFSAWAHLPKDFRQILTWQKPTSTGVIGAKYGYRRDTEAICLIGAHENRPVARSSVITTNGHHIAYANGSHPHAKPVALLESLIEWTGGKVADPFAGSGSTLVAAKRLGRKAIGVELEEKYCEIAANRLAQGVLPLWEGGGAA